MPDSLLDQLKRSAILTAQMGMATRAQYSRHVPNSSTTVHIRATGLNRENRMRICSDNQWYTRQPILIDINLCTHFLNYTLGVNVLYLYTLPCDDATNPAVFLPHIQGFQARLLNKSTRIK